MRVRARIAGSARAHAIKLARDMLGVCGIHLFSTMLPHGQTEWGLTFVAWSIGCGRGRTTRQTRTDTIATRSLRRATVDSDPGRPAEALARESWVVFGETGAVGHVASAGAALERLARSVHGRVQHRLEEASCPVVGRVAEKCWQKTCAKRPGTRCGAHRDTEARRSLAEVAQGNRQVDKKWREIAAPSRGRADARRAWWQ